MNSIFLHRISYHAEVAYPLLDKGYLSIGFSDFCISENIGEIRDEDWCGFENCFDDVWGNRPKNRHTLWRFVRDMKKGDWVVVPNWNSFSIYEIEEDYAISPSELSEFLAIEDWSGNAINLNEELLYSNGNLIDLGFFKKVKTIKKEIPRNEYADSALTSRMKIRQTNANVSDLRESIEKSIIAFDKNQPINIYAQIIEKTSEHILFTIKSELNPDKFELLIQWYFERIGASFTHIPPKNEREKEGDADVVAVFEPLKLIVYTQIKFHGGETSAWAVEQIKNYKEQKERMDDGYSKICWVISSADDFSKQAYELAKENKIQLINGMQFTRMLLEAGITNLERAL